MRAGAIELEINGKPVRVDHVSVTTTLLEYLRENGLPGTKEGCAEGDCGACTVALLDTDAPQGPAWRAVNGCLVLLGSLHGRKVVTVEGLARDEPHPVQKALTDNLGSQCGYCTPGVVMSMFEAAYRTDLDADWKVEDQMCGNLCRCTGYRPIREATHAIKGTCPAGPFTTALQANHEQAPAVDYRHGEDHFLVPTSRDEFFDALAAHPDARIVAGATDLGLDITKNHKHFPTLISVMSIPLLRGIEPIEGGWRIGATTRLSDLETWADTHLVPLARMLRFFGSRQIKNRGTVGGNLVNASPIGDIAPVLFACGAKLILATRDGERTVPVESFFEGYRKTALQPGEVLGAVEIPNLPADARIGSYKVSKRREMDISAVSAAMFVRTDDHNTVVEARFAYGGMAATTSRAGSAEDAVVGQAWTEDTVRTAMDALESDFTPLSDHRGSDWYRKTLARNLLLGFWAETQEEPVVRLPDLPGGTVVAPEVHG